MKVTDEMVTRFLSWPLPDNVQPDGVYPAGDYRKKWGHALMGTNLLDATAAKAMLEHVLAAPPAPDSAKLVSELRLMAHFADKQFPKAHELLAGAANWIEQPAAPENVVAWLIEKGSSPAMFYNWKLQCWLLDATKATCFPTKDAAQKILSEVCVDGDRVCDHLFYGGLPVGSEPPAAQPRLNANLTVRQALQAFVDRYDQAQPADPHEIGLLHRHFAEARAALALDTQTAQPDSAREALAAFIANPQPVTPVEGKE